MDGGGCAVITVAAMDHSSSASSSSQPYHHHQQHQPHHNNSHHNQHHQSQHAIRVIKPNRHLSNGYEPRLASRAPRPSYAPDASTGFPTAIATKPAVKILAKSSSKPAVQSGFSSNSNTTTTSTASVSAGQFIAQPSTSAGPSGKVVIHPTIVASRHSTSGQSRAQLESPSNSTYRPVSQNNNNSNNAGNKSSSNFSILEKQLERLHIVPSAETKEKELLLNCTKLLDGEFHLQDSHFVEKLLLSDPLFNQVSHSSSAAASTASTAVNNAGGQSFCIVGAVGLDGVGKSTLLNTLANQTVFKTHTNLALLEKTKAASTTATNTAGKPNIRAPPLRDNPLSHVTNGVDLHITAERLFLLDTQPLLSASILDEFLRNTNNAQSSFGSSNSYHHHHYSNQMSNSNNGSSLSSVVGFDITEPENFAYIYSMQLLTFMFAICDHLVLVMDTLSFDIYLIKLISTALMMVGDTIPKANLVVYLKPPKPTQSSVLPMTRNTSMNVPGLHAPSASHTKDYELLKKTIVEILGPNVSVDLITDERCLLTTVLKPPSRNLLVTDQQSQPIQYNTERAWYHSVQRFWDNSIRKSSLFVDYARYLP